MPGRPLVVLKKVGAVCRGRLSSGENNLVVWNAYLSKFVFQRHTRFIGFDNDLAVADVRHQDQVGPFQCRVIRYQDSENLILQVFHVI